VVGQIQTLANSTATTNTIILTAGNSATAGSTNVNRLRYGGNDTSANYFTIQGVSNVDYLTINNGNIGIGTTLPTSALQINGVYEGGNDIFTVNVGQNQGLNVDEWGNVDAYFLYVGNIATGWDDNVSTYAISSEDGSDLYLTTDSTGIGNNNILLIPQGTGKVGVHTTNPQATLDVNGYAKLLPQTSAPATCASANKGAIAMTTNNGLCFCNGSAWNKVESPATACAW